MQRYPWKKGGNIIIVTVEIVFYSLLRIAKVIGLSFKMAVTRLNNYHCFFRPSNIKLREHVHRTYMFLEFCQRSKGVEILYLKVHQMIFLLKS